jgi:hypothetical protein
MPGLVFMDWGLGGTSFTPVGRPRLIKWSDLQFSGLIQPPAPMLLPDVESTKHGSDRKQYQHGDDEVAQ